MIHKKFLLFIVFFPSYLKALEAFITINKTTIRITQGNIVNLPPQFQVDAIVNAANKKLIIKGGVSGVIFKAAEGNTSKLENYIKQRYPKGINAGDAIITPSFDLQNKGITSIIFAVGPNCNNPQEKKNFPTLLKNAYMNSLLLAEQHGIQSIAFPFISSAIFKCPKPAIVEIPLDTFIEYAKNNLERPIKLIEMVLYGYEDYKLFKEILERKAHALHIPMLAEEVIEEEKESESTSLYTLLSALQRALKTLKNYLKS